MADPSNYDQVQDETVSVNVKVLKDLVAAVEEAGLGDLTPTEWVESQEPIPFSDMSIYPRYVHGGHLVDDGSQPRLRCICHAYPAPPFNPFWGIEGHAEEKVGITHYDAAKHENWILTFGETTKTERLARIAEVKAALGGA